MSEYIEREKAIKAIGHSGIVQFSKTPEFFASLSTRNEAIKSIIEIPAADVSSVVLCRECKHAKENKDTVTVFCSAFMRDMRGHDFCSYGERKDK